MTNTEAGRGPALKAWLSAGMTTLTLLVLAVSCGLLSQTTDQRRPADAGRPPPVVTPPADTSSAGPEPAPTASGAPPSAGLVLAVGAARLCGSLPAVMAHVAAASRPADAARLIRAASLLDQAITRARRVAVPASRRSDWNRALSAGTRALVVWRSVTPDLAPSVYATARQRGIAEVWEMASTLDTVGPPCSVPAPPPG
jgi:hypothetical protein